MAVAIALAITIWIAHFSQSFHFGLYEDDWAFIGQPIAWTWAHFLDWISMCFTAWPQGRPVGFATVATVAYIGSRIGGLELLYCMAFAFHLGNALLLYAIVRRKLSPAPSLCAALAFSLFPSNTSVPLLTNSFFGSLTVFFLLFAIWLYLKGWRAAAYLVSIGSLLTYESAFLPFFAVPLLLAKPLRQIRRELLKHWAILLAIGGSLFWFRLHIGENKTAAVIKDGLFGTLERIATAMWVGPFTTLRLFFARIITLFHEGDREVWLMVLMVALGLTMVLYFVRTSSSDTLEIWPFSLTIQRFQFRASLTIDETSAEALRVGACGFVMLILAYGLAISTFYYPPNIEAGRLTMTHLSAAVGSALLFGALASMFMDVSQCHHKRIWAVLVLACYFSGLAGFHYRVQQDFRRAWRIQRTFWNSVLRECPDLREGTIIIYEGAYPQPRYVLADSWADPLVLGEVYRFPENWKTPPQLFSGSATWVSDVTPVGDQLLWHPPAPFQDEILPRGNVILLRGSPDGELKRITGTIPIKSTAFPLKPLEPPQLSSYQHQPVIYDLFYR
jgi:hypothetical protein